MTTQELPLDAPLATATYVVSPTQVLASALLHVLDRDEPGPARWRAEAFVLAVAAHRSSLLAVHAVAALDALARPWTDGSFRGAVVLLASDPLAAALAVRRLELTRDRTLPAWPVIVRHGLPRVTHAEASRWFG